MRYPPEQVEQLAAEYVLGTLQGAARRRMDSLIQDRADVRLSVWQWERAMNGLTDAIAPIEPPKAVWREIQIRIGSPEKSPKSATRWWPRLLLATAAAAAIAFWLGTLVPSAAQADRMAVFADESSQALWVISSDADNGRLIAETTGVAAAENNLVYELWALPEGEAPKSLGVLEITAGRYETRIGPELLAALDSSANLAISLEPTGGSPTGLPTGPVVYQARLVRL